jgi:hypothetical protein
MKIRFVKLRKKNLSKSKYLTNSLFYSLDPYKLTFNLKFSWRSLWFNKKIELKAIYFKSNCGNMKYNNAFFLQISVK